MLQVLIDILLGLLCILSMLLSSVNVCIFESRLCYVKSSL